jgi:hypothetical protein
VTPKPIYMLRRSQCRFPVTPDEAPSHLFCAEPVEREGVVYCAEHAAICYDRRPAEKRRADAERAAVMRAARQTPTTHPFDIPARARASDTSIAEGIA